MNSKKVLVIYLAADNNSANLSTSAIFVTRSASFEAK